jgi:hypothetical protein
MTHSHALNLQTIEATSYRITYRVNCIKINWLDKINDGHDLQNQSLMTKMLLLLPRDLTEIGECVTYRLQIL